jgi:hypothetical protein
MNKYISVLALLALPACLGGGDSTTSVPTMNEEFGVSLNGVRMNAGESTLFFEPQLQTAAQVHADDMVANDTLSIFLDGTMTDIGDTLNSMGYSWNDIGQFVAQGDDSMQEVLAEWQLNGSAADGSPADDLTFEDMDWFGIAKSGSGADQRWVLVLTNTD